MPQDILTQLVRDEGMSFFPYRDTVGKTTIGVGRNLTDVGLTKEEVLYLLDNDINRSREDLFHHLPWVSRLDPVRIGALLNMTFNLGIGGLMTFKNTLALIEKGDYEAAAKSMLLSKWANQVGARANRLSEQIRTGIWQ